MSTLRTAWEKDVDTLEDGEWEEVLQAQRVIAIRPELHLAQLQLLHRAYNNGVFIYNMGRAGSSVGSRGCVTLRVPTHHVGL